MNNYFGIPFAEFYSRAQASNKKSAALSCALSMTRQLYHAKVLGPYGGPKAKKVEACTVGFSVFCGIYGSLSSVAVFLCYLCFIFVLSSFCGIFYFQLSLICSCPNTTCKWPQKCWLSCRIISAKSSSNPYPNQLGFTPINSPLVYIFFRSFNLKTLTRNGYYRLNNNIRHFINLWVIWVVCGIGIFCSSCSYGVFLTTFEHILSLSW